MSDRRFMGTETEYGIATPTQPGLSPIITSTHAVVAYAAVNTGARARWDYAEESPLRDVRGFDLRRYHSVPVVDADAVGVANVMIANGARLYVDHAHPEYSSPEVDNAFDAMLFDAAGDEILNKAVADVARLSAEGVSILRNHAPCPPLKIYKNNVDGKGASYGAHENYSLSRSIDFEMLTRALIPFFVTRQIIIGAGRVGLGPEGQEAGFQISQRADYFYQEVSLETTLNRGIINTRDEPHADADRFRRLHTIVGDANLSQQANFLKMGMTKLVLDAIEKGEDFADLQLRDPVAELKAVSRDLQLKHRLRLAGGGELTAVEILGRYLERISAVDPVDAQVIALWAQVLELLAADPLRTAHLLDWTAKWALMRGFLERGASWSDPKLALVDLQYADIAPEKSLYQALVRKGRMETLVSAEEITAAAQNPPRQSRAFFRGRITTLFPEDIVAASWQSVSLRTDEGIARVVLRDVDKLTEAEIGAELAAATSPSDLINRLKRFKVDVTVSARKEGE